MEIYKLSPRGYFGSNTYILLDGGEAAVVDPSVSFSEAESLLSEHSVRYILLTHCHFDHILKINEWVERTGAEVVIGESDAGGLASPIVNCYRYFLGSDDGYFGRVTSVSDGDVLTLGTGKIKVISTPGHTAGGVCYLSGGILIVGDTVFAGGGYGRCDLPGGDEAALFSSISHITELPSGITVYPGHGECTTTDEIKRNFK